jgi:tetratricopeptide (TPR) repeat protein
VSKSTARQSVLVKFYQRYLADGDTPLFITAIAQIYCISTLERLLLSGELQARRAAALALGLLGNTSSLPKLGPLLSSHDRKLRLVADDSLRAISARDGSAQDRHALESMTRLNECNQFEQAIALATECINTTGGTSELFHQRSLAYYQIDCIQNAIADCRQVLKMNPFHYAAMVGLGHCHLELGELIDSLFWFRQALDVYPDMEPIRVQVRRLEKTIQEL